jgi:hypothetical protein
MWKTTHRPDVPIRVRARLRLPLLLVGVGLLAACRQELQPEVPRAAVAPDTAAVAGPLYWREFAFAGERDGTPLVVPLVFSASEAGERIRRRARAWLAHGAEWDPFLDEAWNGPAAAGVWKVEPAGALRVIGGGMANEIEALVFRQGERSLRLYPDVLRATFTPRPELQYRLYDGRLTLGGRTLEGPVLEAYRVQTVASDEDFGEGALDWLWITDGSSVHLLLAETLAASGDPAKTFGWMVVPEAERVYERAEIRWTEMRPVEQARRDAPIAWSFRIPGAAVEGEVFSLGSIQHLGPDRPGRRALVMRHVVEGWVGIGEERHRIFGLLRHHQE